jgi:hypothetical protein
VGEWDVVSLLQVLWQHFFEVILCSNGISSKDACQGVVFTL